MQEASRCKPLKLAKKPPAREEAENLLPEQEKLLDRLNLSVNRVIEKLRLLLEAAASDSKAKPPRSHVIVIRAPWGFGKTHYGKQILPWLARETGLAYVYRNFEAVIDSTLERLQSMEAVRYDEYGGDLTRAAREEIHRLFSEAVAKADKAESGAALLFLDEIEAVLEAAQRHGSGVVSLRMIVASILFNELLAALRQLLHSETETIYRVAAGKVHVILATTPETYATIMDITRKLGIGGRFARRIDVVTLLPLSKTDTLLLIRTLFRDYYGFPEGSWTEAIVNPIHAASGGNPGIVLRIVNALVSEAAAECRTLYGNDCVCSLREPVLLTRLMSRIELPYTPRGNLEKMINPDISRFALEEAKHSVALAKLTAFLEPLDYDSIIAYEVLLANYGLRFYYATLYQCSAREATALLEIAARALANSSSEISFSDARDAMAEILHITDDGSYALLLPAELSDLTEVGLIFANRGLRVSPIALRDSVAVMEEEARKRGLVKRDVWALRLTSLPILYPPAAVKAIPFIRDPEAAARLYREILELRNQMPREYAKLVIEGFNIIMAQLDVLERGEKPRASTKLDLQVEMYGSLYRVPAYIEFYQQRHPIYSLGSPDPNKPLVRLRLITPPGAIPPKPRGDAHAIIDIDLTPGDAEILAALAYAAVRKPDVYLDKLDIAILRDLQRRYIEVLEEQYKKIADHFVSKGIAVPAFLYGERNEFTSPERLLNAYRILLLVSTTTAVVNPEEVVDILFAVYRIRPYKPSRAKEWCGIEVPSILVLDLEPDDHRAYYSLERRKRYLSWLREQIEKILETAEHNMLAKKTTEGHYKLTLHPVEKRLEQLRMKGKEAVEDYFLYPADPGQERQARKLLRDLFLRLLTARREAAIRPNSRDRERLLHIAASIREAANKSIPCNIELGDLIAIVLFKEKGAKVLEPSTTAEVAEKLYEIAFRNSLALEFISLLEKYRDLYTKVGEKIITTLEDYRQNAQEVTWLLNRINNVLKTITPKVKLKAAGDLATLISQETPCIALKAALATTEEVLKEVKRKRPKDLEARHRELMQNFRFHSCDNPYMFAPILYFLDKELRRLPSPQDQKKKLEKALHYINEAVKRIEELPNELHQEALQTAKKQLPKQTIAINDPNQLLQLAKKILEAIEGIERNYEKCSELRKKAESIYSEIKKIVSENKDKFKEEKDFQSKLTKLLLMSTLTQTYDQEYIIEAHEAQRHIEELGHEADTVLSKIRESQERAEKLSRNASNVPCTQLELLEKIVEILENIADRIKTLDEQLARIRSNVKKIYQDVAEKLMKPIDRLEILRMKIEKMLSRTQDIVIATTVKSYLEDYKKIKEKYTNILKLKQDPPANGLEAIKAEAEKTLKKAYETLKESIVRDIGKEAYSILEILLEEPPQGGMDLHKLVHILASKTGLQPETVLTALYNLDKKNYVRVKTML